MEDDGWHSDDNSCIIVSVAENVSRGNCYKPKAYNNSYKKNTFVNSDRYKRNSAASSNSDTIEVESSLVGRIIGRGGSKIRDLEAESQARITIERSNGTNKTNVTVIGTHDAKQKAKDLIESLLVSRPQQHFNNENRNGDNSSYVSYSNRTRGNNTDKYDNSNSSNRETYNESSYPVDYNDASSYGNQDEGYQKVVDKTEDVPIDWTIAYKESVRLQEEHWATLPPIYKDFYTEDPEIAGMSSADVKKWRLENFNITVERICEPKDSVGLISIPNPVHTFEQAFSAYPEILDEISKQNFEMPSPIQAQAWPVLLSGQDLIGIAQTGTGKTLAFLLPALIHIDRQPIPVAQRNGPNVLILAPTRELAVQIDKEVNKYHYKGIKSCCVYGGTSRKDQINVVSKGVQIVIATPGRLNDLVSAGHINIEAITYLVLDEADRMLDMGFEPQIRRSLLEIRPTRQTVMTSATWPQAVQRLAQSYMKNPIQVVVGTLDLAAVHTVRQELVFVNDDTEEKFGILLDFFKSMDPSDKVIVFCSRKATAIHISSDMALLGYNYQSIYSGLDQSDREQALEDMRNDVVNILVATDVASRGIDINNITHIINFDFPHSLEEFVHRVGRTGRAGRAGTAITYMTRKDWANAAGLINILEEAGQEIPLELVNMAERFKKKQFEKPGGRGRGGRGRGQRRQNAY